MEDEPRIGVFADDENFLVRQRADIFKGLTDFQTVLVTGNTPLMMRSQLTPAVRSLERVDLVITDQYFQDSDLNKVMGRFLRQLRRVNRLAWIVETGMGVIGGNGQREFPESDAVMSYSEFYYLQKEIKEVGVAKNFKTQLQKLISETGPIFREAKRAEGRLHIQGNPFIPRDSLEEALNNDLLPELLLEATLSRSDLDNILVLPEGRQRDVLHCLWMGLAYKDRGYGIEFYGSSLDRLKSLLQTGLPSKMLE